ncbi:MAG: hypothetical protein AAB460_00180 [Patescibacteria group bacterium]
MELHFRYSPESEADRIGYTLDKYRWYKENNYRINLPDSLKAKAECGERVEDEEITKVVTEEFDTVAYDNAIKLLESEFRKIERDFTKNLKSLGVPVHDTYTISLTKYGVGGSYSLPNNVQVNIDYGRTISWITLAHEIVHLAIEEWVKKYKIEHWTKERMVDLIMDRFFPGEVNIQGKPEDLKEVKIAFDSHFPNIQKVIEEVVSRRQE